MTDSYIGGTTRPHRPAEDEGISLAGHGIPPEAIETWNALQGALLNASNTPCNSDNRADWTSGRGNARQRAIEGCMGCPVLEQCAAYAEAANETGAVWGGVAR